MFKAFTTWGLENTRKLFLIDGVGAIVSAFLLGVVLVQLEHWFGIPRPTLYLLAVIPCFFATYDFYNYTRKDAQRSSALKGIAVANLLYCCLSLGFAIYHYPVLTPLGWGYILSEIGIVVALAYVELSVLKALG